jgi:DNA-binding beta-propeller fold protein YncE
MKKLLFAILISLSLAFVLMSPNSLLANPNERDHGGHAQLADLYVFGELGGERLGLINTATDQLIQIDLLSLPGWPQQSPTQDAAMQHVWSTPNGKTLYFTLDAIYPDPSAVVVLGVEGIDWDAGTADLVVQKILPLDPPGMASQYPSVTQIDPSQPIATWTQPGFSQAHGPTFQPHSAFTYFTHWTDNRIRIIDRRTNELLEPLIFGDKSQQTHGVNFNPSGQLALGTGYFYDNNEIDVYKRKKGKNKLTYVRSIKLGNDKAYAAFTHFTYWLNNRFALTASMQLGPTSLTPHSANIIGPSVWLLDVRKGRAKQIIGTAATAADEGIYQSGSDLVVAGHKLYVAEEDTIDGSFGNDGNVSIFDISNIRQPRFLKRLKPSDGLPPDFVVAHGLNVTVDERFVYVASYASHYILKIDTETDEVVKTFGPNDGLKAPHGAFIAGQYR